MDGEAWWALVHGVAKSRTRLRDFTSTSTESQGASLVAQLVKNLPAMQETWVLSLVWEDLLEKEMATHSSILALKITWTEEPDGLQSMGLQRVRHDLPHMYTRFTIISSLFVL